MKTLASGFAAFVLLSKVAAGQETGEIVPLISVPAPLIVETEMAKIVDMPAHGTAMVSVKLTVSAQYGKPVRLSDPHGCSTHVWAVVRKTRSLVFSRKTLPDGDTEVMLDNAVEQHTRCSANQPDGTLTLEGHQTVQFALSFPLDASRYQEGETYRFWIDFFESGGGADFTVRKRP
jgi:hypothetical protein